jgi:hypothetical protein
MLKYARKVLDTADIVRDAMFFLVRALGFMGRLCDNSAAKLCD